MLVASISSFEAELLARYWLGLIAAHEGMRMMDCYSSTEDRQDGYASQRCEALLSAGLLTEGEFERLKSESFARLEGGGGRKNDELCQDED